MVDVGESVDTREWVVIHHSVHAIYYARGAGRRSDFTGIEHVERKGIVWLVARTVSHGYAGLDA